MRDLHELSSPRAVDHRRPDEQGAALVEVLVAMLLAAVMAVGTAALSGTATRAVQEARVRMSALALAEQRLEQLRALVWTGGVDDVPRRSDAVANLSVQPTSASGAGLRPSPGDALEVNRAGYVDFLDAEGRWVGGGTRAPEGAVFVRRWSIEPAPHDPVDIVVLRVVVAPVVAGEAVRLATLKARKVR